MPTSLVIQSDWQSGYLFAPIFNPLTIYCVLRYDPQDDSMGAVVQGVRDEHSAS